MVELLNFESLGLIFAGIFVGGILGAFYGYSHDDNRKTKAIMVFGGILATAIGGGLYFFSLNGQLEVFNIFTISYSVAFIIIGLIAKKIHQRYHGFAGGKI